MKRFRIGGALVLAATCLSPGLTIASPAHTASKASPTGARIGEIRNAVSDQIANYALLVDGDGVQRDARVWADALWTDDALFQTYDAAGRPIFTDPTGLHGREQIHATFAPILRGDFPLRVRHLFLDIRFDRITANEVDQRMVGYIVRGWRESPPPGADPALVQPSSYIYHNRWRREADGIWRLSRSIVYCAFNCASAPK